MRKVIQEQFERFFLGAIINFERALDNDVMIAKRKIDEVKGYLDTAKKHNHPDAETYKTMLKQTKTWLNGKIALKNNFAEIKDKIMLAVRGVLTNFSETESTYV